MLRKVFLSMLMFIFANMMHAAAADEDYILDYSFEATPVVRCVNNGEFEHNIYYFASGNNKCLVVLCHGFVNNDGYGILMHNQYRHDYAQAVAESIAYWTSRGMLKNVGDFNYVFMNTCYAGYAQQTVRLPVYGINLERAIDYKGITAFSESPIGNGRVRINLYRVVPKYVNSARSISALSDFLSKNKVRGYRAIGSVSKTKPAGLITLCDPYQF